MAEHNEKLHAHGRQRTMQGRRLLNMKNNEKTYIGCHLSVTDGYEAMGRTIKRLGGNTFAFFTRNPRGGKTKPLNREDTDALLRYMEQQQFGPIVAHGSYTMNLCSSNEATRTNGLDMLAQDLERMEYLPGNYYNFHPGSHTGLGTEAGIRLIADALNRVLTPKTQTTVLLETMAGKGSEIGSTFDELREIIDRVDYPEKLGVCLDTCHVWDAGYDLAGDPDGVLHLFDEVIGISRLKAVHFNDSKNDCGSHKDRHAKLGQGAFGVETLKRIALHPLLKDLPFILETPNDHEGYREEIRMVTGWREDE